MPDNTEPGRTAVPDLVSARNCKAHRLVAWSLVALAALAALAAILASTVPRRRRGTRHLPRTRPWHRRRTSADSLQYLDDDPDEDEAPHAGQDPRH
ncbi:hypothetical protein [Actinomadura montaniterrae]|uniref:Uncharacterized protein n=1 Tax=Actinomadura montaniterrae TaxID=1803903 RepID=A0A6L3VGM1_9ACTN|nr:hypothetical protein [Actinomadura montaniterrae]KAB2367194.1 hypothetical protein F9B16_38760 [Actinomadura montaniterrae]